MMKINFILKASNYSISALVRWILSVCLNIHLLQLSITPQKPSSFLNEIVRLKKLKDLVVSADEASDLKEVTLIGFRIMTIMTVLTSS